MVLKMRQERAARKDRPVQVDLDSTRPVVPVHGLARTERPVDAGVVHEDVHLREYCEGSFRERGHIRGTGYVDAMCIHDLIRAGSCRDRTAGVSEQGPVTSA